MRTTRTTAVALVLGATLAGVPSASAQNTPAGAATATPAPARPAPGTGIGASPKNIRFDIDITDTGTATPIRKNVIVNVSQGGGGSIRSSAQVPGMPTALPKTVTTRGADGRETSTTQTATPTIALNVDVTNPVIYEDGGIRALIAIEYQPYTPASGGTLTQPPVVRANSLAVLESGKKIILLQAADPLTDRRTTIEVTATMLK